MTLALFKFVVSLTYIESVMNNFPVTIVCNMIDTNDTTGSRVSVSGTFDSADSKLDCFVVGHLVSVVSVKNTISEGTSGTDSKESALKTGSVIIDIIKTGTILVRSSKHGSHAESTSAVLSHDAAEDHRGHGNGAFLSMSKLVDSAQHSNVLLPE